MITHGHLHHVKLGTAFLYSAAKKHGCTLALFGHTHQPYQKQCKDAVLVNPGALLKGQWALIHIGEKVETNLRVL